MNANATPLVNVTIPGEPVPKGRPRLAPHGNVYTPRKTTEAEKTVGWYLKAAWLQEADPDGQFSVHCTFYLSTRRHTDLDNLQKLCLDALNHVVWKDDSQVHSIQAIKLIDKPNPRTIIRIYRFQELHHDIAS